MVGDGNGMVGVGYGKAKEVPAAIAKGVEEAEKHFFRVPRIQGTIRTGPGRGRGRRRAAGRPPRYRCDRGWPGARGAGVRGHPRRALESLGSDNPINIVHATVAALKQFKRPEEIAARRGLPLEHVAPAAMLRARAEGLARPPRKGGELTWRD